MAVWNWLLTLVPASWYWGLELASLLLVGATVIVGGAALIASRAKAVADEKEILILRERTATAERAAIEAGRDAFEVRSALLDRKVVPLSQDQDNAKRKELWQPVIAHKGVRAVVRSVMAEEPHKLAENIAWVLKQCGWDAEVGDPIVPPLSLPFPEGGVIIATAEPTPAFFTSTNWAEQSAPPKFSNASLAAMAAANLFDLDLGAPGGGPAFFGVHWEAQYPADGPVPSTMLRWGYVIPANGVLILVGSKPIMHLETMRPPK